MDREQIAQIAFGFMFLTVGVGAGYFMCTHPENLNPHWPLGMALLAPAAFVLGGLHIIAAGLGLPRLSSATVIAVALCLLAVGNWAAFFTSNFQCVTTVSFLGVVVKQWFPSEMECRQSLRVLMGGFDVFLLLLFVFAGYGYRSRSKARGPAR